MNSFTPNKPLWLIKLGGSIITDDQEFMTSRDDIITNVLFLLAEYSEQYQFVIVHGAGSFGHPLAKSYKLSKGFQFDRQNFGVVLTHNAMLDLNHLLVEIGQKLGLHLVSFPPISSVITNNGRIKNWNLKSLTLALSQGFIPVIFGDVVFDESIQFTILSGDQIVPYLANQLNASKIVMLTDVDGVYSKNPKFNPSAYLINEINVLDEDLLKQIFSTENNSGKIRVTGEMGKKLDELIPILRKGIETFVISGLKSEFLRSHLEGKKPYLGTKLLAKE
ncbi:MAG: Isopentenyl phosphate kinase [Candidatus Heimdallarchaeota archaeon LC_3]|nr:MAG: Isopentenyl phosphate kinase [Candidatus Heimdallarchaeota archaeon LC_3]